MTAHTGPDINEALSIFERVFEKPSGILKKLVRRPEKLIPPQAL